MWSCSAEHFEFPFSDVCWGRVPRWAPLVHTCFVDVIIFSDSQSAWQAELTTENQR